MWTCSACRSSRDFCPRSIIRSPTMRITLDVRYGCKSGRRTPQDAARIARNSTGFECLIVDPVVPAGKTTMGTCSAKSMVKRSKMRYAVTASMSCPSTTSTFNAAAQTSPAYGSPLTKEWKAWTSDVYTLTLGLLLIDGGLLTWDDSCWRLVIKPLSLVDRGVDRLEVGGSVASCSCLATGRSGCGYSWIPADFIWAPQAFTFSSAGAPELLRSVARDAVKASIFFSSSATRLVVCFCRLRLEAVTRHCRFAFAHLWQGAPMALSSLRHGTLRCRQASQARSFRLSLDCGTFLVEPSWPLLSVCMVLRRV